VTIQGIADDTDDADDHRDDPRGRMRVNRRMKMTTFDKRSIVSA
jgi:hypothetical protein